jgi:hypothetical protein
MCGKSLRCPQHNWDDKINIRRALLGSPFSLYLRFISYSKLCNVGPRGTYDEEAVIKLLNAAEVKK